MNDNGAVVPLTKGRRIPVDLSDAAGGRIYAPNMDISGDIHVHVEKQQNGEADEAFAQRLIDAMDEKLNEKIDGRIFEQSRYGRMLTPR